MNNLEITTIRGIIFLFFKNTVIFDHFYCSDDIVQYFKSSTLPISLSVYSSKSWYYICII